MKKIFLPLFPLILLSCKNNNTDKRSGFIKTGNLNVYYVQEGKGPDLILLHAGFQQMDMWDAQVSAFKEKFRILRIDMPAHGRTEGKDTVTLFTEVLKNIMDTLEIKQASLAGLSMGSVSAQDFAIAHPERVNKLILLAPGVNGYEKDHPIDSLSMSWYGEMMEQLNKGDTTKAALVFTKAWADGPYRDQDMSRPVTSYVAKTTEMNIRVHKLSGWPVLQQNPPAYERLTSIKMPVLIIHGDKDLPYIMEASKFLEKQIPGSKRILIKDVAHMLNMEKTNEFNDHLLQFLNQDK